MAKPKSLNINSNAEAAELESLLKNGNITIVVILAEWCGACQRVKPDWLNTLKRKNKHNVALIDSEVLPNTVLNDKLNVTHFPSVFEVKPNGKATLLKNVNDPNAVVNAKASPVENSLSLLELNENARGKPVENSLLELNENAKQEKKVFTPSLEKLKGGRRGRRGTSRRGKRRSTKRRSTKRRSTKRSTRR
jgi:thiol-disulfide isomerase/thioredoxin